MWINCKVEQTKCAKQGDVGAGVWSQWRRHPVGLGQSGEYIATNQLLREPIETFVKYESAIDFKGFEALHNSTLTTNCFAPMFKRKMSNICMINRNDHCRCFSETLTNWHWMSNVKKSCICGKWLYMTCSNNKVWTLIFVKKIAHLTRMHT